MKGRRLEYSYIKEQTNKYGYTLLSKTYINAHAVLKVECQALLFRRYNYKH